MTNIVEAIDNFSKTYLEQREDNAWDMRTHGPLGENLWAQKALEKLLFPKGYRRMKDEEEEEPKENTDFVRYNSDSSIDRILFNDDLNDYQRLFGNTRNLPPESRNIIVHLRFLNREEAERYEQLGSQMWELADAEGATHRGGVEYRPIYAVLGGAMGGLVSFLLARAPIPWQEIIGLDPGVADSFVALSLITFGGVGGWSLGKYKMNQISKSRTKLKRDYDQLFSEFKDTFGSRFTYGKEALMKAPEV